MPDYITPSDISALNSAVQSNESYGAAKRGAEGILERISASREAAGLSDSDIFHALSRGADKKSGLHWLSRLLATLTEYLGSWGTLVLLGVSFVSTLIMLKQNAKHIWTTISDFVTKHPLITAAMGTAAGFGAAYIMKDDVDDAADALIALAASALPAPVAFLVNKVSKEIANAPTAGAIDQYGATDYAAEAEAYNQASALSPTNRLMQRSDAYTRDAYTRDAYSKRGKKYDTFSGNIGS